MKSLCVSVVSGDKDHCYLQIKDVNGSYSTEMHIEVDRDRIEIFQSALLNAVEQITETRVRTERFKEEAGL